LPRAAADPGHLGGVLLEGPPNARRLVKGATVSITMRLHRATISGLCTTSAAILHSLATIPIEGAHSP
jgi:hypothetical protein